VSLLPPWAAEIVEDIHHPNRLQLMYQVREIFIQRLYLQHGVEVAPGDLVLDVGANVGVSAAFFAAACKATVHSFEPVAPLFALLTETAASFPSCTPHNLALGARTGEAEILYYPKADAMSGLYADPEADRAYARAVHLSRGIEPDEADRRLEGMYDPVRLTCEVRRLSDVVAELGITRVDLLKIDVERSELDVLVGIDEADWPMIGQVVAEVHDEGGRLDAFTGLLDDHGFRWVRVQEPGLEGTSLHMVYARRTSSAGG
jgi:31-O-methyltransferase